MLDFDTVVLDTRKHDGLAHTLGFEMGVLFFLFTHHKRRIVVVLHEDNKDRALRLARRMGWNCTSWYLCGTEVARGAFTLKEGSTDETLNRF